MAAARLLVALSVALAAAPVVAQEREFCAERPGLETPPCTVDPGHVQIEAALADWTLDKQPDSRTDTILVGDFMARIGLTDALEGQIGWTPYGHVRTRDRLTGAVTRQGRTGDVTLALKQNLRNPDGSGLSIALKPFATLPVGREPVGAGDWGGGLIGSLGYQFGGAFQLVLSPEIDAAVDQDGDGRHLAYGGVVGLSADLSKKFTVTADVEEQRDRDPSGHETMSLAALAVAWQPKDKLQLDLGSVVGLNRASPDVELYVGLSRKF